MSKAYVIAPNSRALQPVSRARGAQMAVLIGPDDGAPNFAKRRFVLAPNGRIPAHLHPNIEHEQVVVAGEMTLGLGDETIVARQGDIVFIPAQTAHWYFNHTDAPCEFLCTVPITATYETEWLEDPPDGATP